ncbi:MAG: molybdate ABC transporter substrate-binding protein [Chloroflexi bacterium]|nr:molybdate ABC transporter substrate-binding protein [Chloroflexota bacterium]
MKFKTLSMILVVALLWIAVPPSAHAQDTTLTVFAAASLMDAFEEIGGGFEATHAGVQVEFQFGSSSDLAAQLSEGAPADIFASANNKQMTVARDAGRIEGKARTFAKNRLVVIVPADNPAGIESLHDLANDGVLLIIAADGVPVRDYTNAMVDKLVNVSGYGEDYKTAFFNNVVSEEDNVRQVSAKVALGEADAGLVYVSDVTPDIAGDVKMIAIPDTYNTLATYPIAVTNDSPNQELAQAFVDYVLSDAGQDTLVAWNFISVRIPGLHPSVVLPTDGTLYVGGQVYQPLTLTIDDLQTYSAQTVDVTYLSGEDTVNATFTGVLLWDILSSAQVNINADVENDKLSLFIVATGSDGYQAVISWGEIDPEFGNQGILVAYAKDGAPITSESGTFQLVVPGDGRGGRYVSGLVSVEVRDAPPVE